MVNNNFIDDLLTEVSSVVLNIKKDFGISNELSKVYIDDFVEFLKAIDHDWIPYPTQLNMVRFASEEGVKSLMTKRYLAKTDLITILLTAFQLHKYPKKTQLLIGATYELAKGWIEHIGNIVKNNPSLYPMAKVSKTRIRTQENLNNKDPSVCIGTLRTVLRGKHPHRIVLDDLLTLENESKKMKELAYKKYSECLSLAMTGESIDIIVIGNPVSSDDLYSHLRNLETVKTLEIWNSDIDKEKEPLIYTDIEKLRQSGMREYEVQANFFGRIVARGNELFKNIKKDKKAIISSYYPSVLFIDPNKKSGDNSDYTAFTIAQPQPSGKIHVTGFITKQSLRGACKEFLQFIEKSENIKSLSLEIYYEDVGLGDEGERIIHDELGIASIGKSYSMKKEERIRIASLVSEHIVLCENIANNSYINQILCYNENADYDDAPDSLASALERLNIIEFKTEKPEGKYY